MDWTSQHSTSSRPQGMSFRHGRKSTMKSTQKSSKSTRNSGRKSAAKTPKSSPSLTGTKLTKEQERIRKELNTQGWSLVDTSRFNLDFTVNKQTASYTKLNGNGVPSLQSTFSDFWYSQKNYRERWKTPDSLIPLRRFLARTISKCLPKENLSIRFLQLRLHDGKKAKNPGDWHVDGGAIRAITSVEGTTTEFLPHPRSKKIRSVPKGWTLFFTGTERIFNGKSPKRDYLGNVIQTNRQCLTRHRMPIHNGKRKLIVTTFAEKVAHANTSRQNQSRRSTLRNIHAPLRSN